MPRRAHGALPRAAAAPVRPHYSAHVFCVTAELDARERALMMAGGTGARAACAVTRRVCSRTCVHARVCPALWFATETADAIMYAAEDSYNADDGGNFSLSVRICPSLSSDSMHYCWRVALHFGGGSCARAAQVLSEAIKRSHGLSLDRISDTAVVAAVAADALVRDEARSSMRGGLNHPSTHAGWCGGVCVRRRL